MIPLPLMVLYSGSELGGGGTWAVGADLAPVMSRLGSCHACKCSRQEI